MDSDDSQDSFSGESDDKRQASPTSSRSHSRQSARSVASRSSSILDKRHSPDSPRRSRHSSSQSGGSDRSRSSSPEENDAHEYQERSRSERPQTPKSPGNISVNSAGSGDNLRLSRNPVRTNRYSSGEHSSQSSSDEESTEEPTKKTLDKSSIKSGSSNRSSSREASPKSQASHKSQSSAKSSQRSASIENKSYKSGQKSRSVSSDRQSVKSMDDDPPEKPVCVNKGLVKLAKSPRRSRSHSRDRQSVKSISSHTSSSSHSSRKSRKSFSGSERSLRNGRQLKDDDRGSSSDSSDSSADSSRRRNKSVSRRLETQAEEISDGDIESDHDKEEVVEPIKDKKHETNQGLMRHDDLSDVSDSEDSLDAANLDDKQEDELLNEDFDRKTENGITSNGDKGKMENMTKKTVNKETRPEDGEEQLDFEAEDGECPETDIQKEAEEKTRDDTSAGATKEDIIDTEKSRAEKEQEELEEGEVTDEDDARPEETEPRPVCRFFSRGQCTWGASCRFLHPGVTDKGNYTMFEMIRPVIPGEYGRDERFYGRPEPPPMESAWERGLRTAKEMLKKSIKRKEQDIDFEEKKMNLSLAQEEFDKENGYYGRVPSPEPTRYVRHVPVEYPAARPPVDEYYNRRQVIYEPEYVPPPRERVRPSYRELPTHKMPDYYNSKYEEEQPVVPVKPTARTPKSKREVIVEREERQTRGDEWQDPWMRSKSPAGRKANRKRSYSSGSSFSSSSSSHTSSDSSHSSYRSRSRSKTRNRRSKSHHGRSRRVSPSVIVSERKAANERAAAMNPPAPRKRPLSPGMRMTNAANPPAPSKEDHFGRTKRAVAAVLAKVKGRRKSSRSSSESSGSTSSDSDSSGSSSSTSRDASSSPPRRPGGMVDIAKAMDALKGAGEKRQIKLTLKNPIGVRKADIAEVSRKAEIIQSKKRPANSPPSSESKAKKSTSRREELLKQLKAVEDAIAKKRSKVN